MTMQEETRFRYEEPEGVVYVRVVAAVVRDEYVGGLSGTGRVEVRRPALVVTTCPNRWDRGAGVDIDAVEYVTLRGRRYSIDEAYYFQAEYPEPHRWSADHRDHHTRGRRNEAGLPVDYKSATYGKLRAIAERVRDRFVAEHPQWAATSVRLRIQGQIRQAQERAADLRAEAAKEDDEAAKLCEELDAVAGDLS